MPTKIVDLDTLVGEDKIVVVGGKRYRLPPDIPVQTFLRIRKYGDEGLENDEVVARLYDEVLELFRYGDKDIKELPPSMTTNQVVTFIGEIYGGEGEDEEPDPTPAATDGAGPRTSRSCKTRSASKT